MLFASVLEASTLYIPPRTIFLGDRQEGILSTKFKILNKSSWKTEFYDYYRNNLINGRCYCIHLYTAAWDAVLFGIKVTNNYGFFLFGTPYQDEFYYIDVHDGALYENTGK